MNTNLRTAKALSLGVLPTLLAQATPKRAAGGRACQRIRKLFAYHGG